MLRRFFSALAATLGIASIGLAVACGDGDETDEPAPEGVIAFGGVEGGQHGVYLVNADGSGLQRLANEDGPVSFPLWSPDAQKLAYVVGAPGEAGKLRVFDRATSASTTLAADALVQLFEPAYAWAGENDQLAFIRSSGDVAVHRFDSTGTETTDVRGASGIDWSPDGDEVAVIADAGDDPELYVSSLAGEDPTPLLRRPGVEHGPRWSPEGGRIAFWSGEVLREAQAFVTDRDGDDLRELGAGFAPVWHQNDDEAMLAFSRPLDVTASDIFIIGPGEDAEARNLTNSVTDDRWPSWWPGGDQIAYLGVVDQTTSLLCVVRTAGGGDCLDLPAMLVSAPAWSPR